MKKILSMLLVLSMLLSASAALAEGMGVQVIGGPEAETEPVSLDDIKLNTPFTIEGYGEFEFTSVAYVDYLASYGEGRNSYIDRVYSSGKEAQYLLANFDILNNTTAAKDYLAQVEVVVVFNDTYEYKGWCYQYNHNNKSNDYSYVKTPNGENIGYGNPVEHVIATKDNFAIDPMYEGHYVFGCTLPNAVVESKEPLKMVITIDGNELTYNVRK